jgi:hypothetical protein
MILRTLQRIQGKSVNYRRLLYRLGKMAAATGWKDDNAGYIQNLCGDDSPSLSWWSVGARDITSYLRLAASGGRRTTAATTDKRNSRKTGSKPDTNRTNIYVASLPLGEGSYWIVPEDWVMQECVDAIAEVFFLSSLSLYDPSFFVSRLSCSRSLPRVLACCACVT